MSAEIKLVSSNQDDCPEATKMGILVRMGKVRRNTEILSKSKGKELRNYTG